MKLDKNTGNMVYDYAAIGKRINEERENAGYSVEDLKYDLEILCNYKISESTLYNVFAGKVNSLKPELMFNLCSIFNCELDYLYCKTDSKIPEITDIAEQTGFTEEAVIKLRKMEYLNSYTGHFDVLSFLILHPKISDLLTLIGAVPSENVYTTELCGIVISQNEFSIINNAIRDIIIEITEDYRQQRFPQISVDSKELQDAYEAVDKAALESETDIDPNSNTQ